ncbi:hypothetical protein Q3G72_016247 [Acer saccharum]|nr:hypothetical protein Q3G72_016247 [Acer saccharum]
MVCPLSKKNRSRVVYFVSQGERDVKVGKANGQLKKMASCSCRNKGELEGSLLQQKVAVEAKTCCDKVEDVIDKGLDFQNSNGKKEKQKSKEEVKEGGGKKDKDCEKVKERGGKRDKDFVKGSGFQKSKVSFDIKKGMADNLGNGGLDCLSLDELSDRRRLFEKMAWGFVLEILSKKGLGCNADKGSTSLMCADRGSKVGDPSIEVFVDLRNQASSVENGENKSSLIKTTTRKGGKIVLLPKDIVEV